MSYYIELGIVCGFFIALFMRVVPLFHGYDSNDIKRITFRDNHGKEYILVTEKVKCN